MPGVPCARVTSPPRVHPRTHVVVSLPSLRRAYLMFEFWRLVDDAVDDRSLENIYFLVARGVQPNVGVAARRRSE